MTLRVLYPPSVLAPDAPYAKHVHDDILPATIAREQAAADRAARDKRELDDTLHHPLIWILALFALGARARAAARRASRTCASAASTGRGSAPKYVNDPPDDLAPALVPSLLAQKVVAGGDQLTATLFELVRRGRYKMTPVTREESSFAGLRHKEIDDVDLTRGDEGIALSPVEKPVAAIFDRLTEDGPVGALAGRRAPSRACRRAIASGSTAAPRRSSRPCAARRGSARFWSGRGMLVKWIAFGAFVVDRRARCCSSASRASPIRRSCDRT